MTRDREQCARGAPLGLRAGLLVWLLALLAACGPSGGASDGGAESGSGNEGGTSGDGGSGAEGGAEPDPCGELTQAGRCANDMGFDYCLVESERGTRQRAHTDCGQGERCMVQGGRATCALVADCRDGDTECSGNQLRTCASGAWSLQDCANGCVSSGTGAACAPAMSMGTRSGRVRYQWRDSNADHTDWLAPTPQPLRSAMVLVFRGSMLVASTRTSEADGTFTVRVPDTLMPGDKLTVVASSRRSDGRNLGWVIADARLSAGMHPEADTDGVNAPTPWSWSWDLDTQPAGNLDLEIAEADGSGAASVFDWFGVAWREATMRYMEPPSIVVWMSNNVAWRCGACVAGRERRVFNQRFPQQMWFLMDNDRSFFSRPVIGHEAGHWLSNAFSANPGEGGDHQGNCPSPPGLAWNEGVASWFGQVLLDNPVYFDRQNGAFLWSDYSMRVGSDPTWRRPSATGRDIQTSRDPGLLQLIPENEVSAILWSLSGGRSGAAPLFQALAAPRFRDSTMLNGAQGWERGYRTSTWSGMGDNCALTNLRALDDPAPCLPDFLDALVCAGFDRARVRSSVGTEQYYPYNPDNSLCRN